MIVTTAARRMSKPAAAAVPDPVVLIRSSAYASLPSPGNRIDPTDEANMPKIVASGTSAAFTFAAGAHDYRLVGIEIKSGTNNNVVNLIEGGIGATSEANLPSDITFDRCYIHNASGIAGRRGMWLNAIRGAVIDSYISGFREAGSDSQAILITNTPGPCKIVNNYLEAASENFHIGGVDPTISNCVPSDIEFRRNYCFKPLAWDGAGYNVKNLIEFKNAQRVLVEGNVFENNWADGQSGLSFLITPRNQSNTAPWSVTKDITARLNKILNVEGGFNVTGSDSDYSSQITTRVTLSDNFLKLSYAGAGDHRGIQLVTSHAYQSGAHPINVHYINNTTIHTNAGGTSGTMDSDGTKLTGIVVRDNVMSNAAYGFLGNGTGDGNATINGHFDTDAVFSHNIIIGGTSGNYTGRSCQFPADVAAVSFTNTATDDYSLSGSSAYLNDGSDGTNPGADWTALNAATENTVDGQWGSEPATYADFTYTNAELPRSYVNTTYVAQTGNLWTVTSTSGGSVAGTGDGNRTDCSLAYALANCAIGDIIEITAGNTITGNFTLRNIT